MKKETVEQLNKILMEEGYRIVPVNKTTVIIEGNVSIPSLDGCSEYLRCAYQPTYKDAPELSRIYHESAIRRNHWNMDHFEPATKEEWLTQIEKDQFEVGGFARPLITCGDITKNRIVRVNKIEQKNNDGNWHIFFDTEEGEMFSHISNFVPATKKEWVMQGAKEYGAIEEGCRFIRDWLIITRPITLAYYGRIDFTYDNKKDQLWLNGLLIYEKDKWAKKVPPEVEVSYHENGLNSFNVKIHNATPSLDYYKLFSDAMLELKRKLNE